jgi:hypothetical protein
VEKSKTINTTIELCMIVTRFFVTKRLNEHRSTQQQKYPLDSCAPLTVLLVSVRKHRKTQEHKHHQGSRGPD